MTLFTAKNGQKIICFSKQELFQLYKNAKRNEAEQEMAKREISAQDLKANPTKMEELSTFIGERGAQLHELIKTQDFKFGGNILLSYNSKNAYQVIVAVYPTLVKTKIPIQKPSTKNF